MLDIVLVGTFLFLAFFFLSKSDTRTHSGAFGDSMGSNFGALLGLLGFLELASF